VVSLTGVSFRGTAAAGTRGLGRATGLIGRVGSAERRTASEQPWVHSRPGHCFTRDHEPSNSAPDPEDGRRGTPTRAWMQRFGLPHGEGTLGRLVKGA